MWPFKKSEPEWYERHVPMYKIRMYQNEIGLAMYVPTYLKMEHTSAAGYFHSWPAYHEFYLNKHPWIGLIADTNDIKEDTYGNRFIGCASEERARFYIDEYKKRSWNCVDRSHDIDVD